jgi:hypothetical protein
MGHQAGPWVEIRVSVYIKQELPSILGRHQLRRLGIKKSSGNIRILRIFRSFAAVNGTSGRTMPGTVGTHQLRRLDIKESFENTEILRIFCSFVAIYESPGRIVD